MARVGYVFKKTPVDKNLKRKQPWRKEYIDGNFIPNERKDDPSFTRPTKFPHKCLFDFTDPPTEESEKCSEPSANESSAWNKFQISKEKHNSKPIHIETSACVIPVSLHLSDNTSPESTYTSSASTDFEISKENVTTIGKTLPESSNFNMSNSLPVQKSSFTRQTKCHEPFEDVNVSPIMNNEELVSQHNINTTDVEMPPCKETPREMLNNSSPVSLDMSVNTSSDSTDLEMSKENLSNISETLPDSPNLNMYNSSPEQNSSFNRPKKYRKPITDVDFSPIKKKNLIHSQNNSITTHAGTSPSIETIRNMPNNSSITMVIPVTTDFDPNKKTPSPNVLQEKIYHIDRFQTSHEEINSKSKRKWDRKNFCVYCKKLITNFSKHMKRMHVKEESVLKYCAILDSNLKIRKQRRQAVFDELRKQGNFLYNQEVLRGSITPPTQSMLLPVRRSFVTNSQITSQVHCKVCLGLFSRKTFYRHASQCVEKKKDDEDILPVKNSFIKEKGLELILCSDQASEILREKIYPLLRKDQKGIAAVTDPLIVSVASDFLSNHTSDKDKYNVTNKMRDAGALLLKMKEKDPTILNFKDCFDVQQIDNMISSVQEMSQSNSTGTVGVVGMPARLSWVIQKSCSKIIEGIITNQSFTDNKDNLKRKIMDFQSVIRRRLKYSTNAEKTRQKNAVKKDVVLPDDSDIKLFLEELTYLEQDYRKKLTVNPTFEHYERLCEAVIAKLIVVNRRRSGEVANAELEFYIDRREGTVSDEIVNQLSDDEKSTLDMFDVFLIPGKLVRTVPILLSKTTAQNIDLLISCRSKLGIPESNKLLFARPGTENPFIGANVIRKIQICLKLKKPAHMTATGLRYHSKVMQNKQNGYVGEDWHNNDDEDGPNDNDEDCHNNNEKLNSKKKRKWDRKNFCVYCQKLITNFSKHMKIMHSKEESVLKYCAILDSDLKIRKQRRQAVFDELRKQGNFLYNQEVLRGSITPPTQSMLLPVRRSPGTNSQITSQVHCKVCLGLFSRKTFYRHASQCVKKKKDEDILPVKNSFIKEKGLELNLCSDQASELLREKIFPLLRKDQKGIAAVTDPLIASVASDFLSNHTSDKDKYNVTNKIRDAGALLLKMKEKDPTILNFKDCFDVQKIDNMISSVQEMSQSNSSTGTVGVVGMPARLSWVIQKSCSKIIEGIITNQSFTDNQDNLKRKIMDFQSVIRRRLKYSINAEKTRQKNAVKKDVVLPDDSDIKLFLEELTYLEQEYRKKLTVNPTFEHYERLCEAVIAKLIVVNRRRSGEVANAELEFYIDRREGTVSDEIVNQLSDDEKSTLDMFDVFLIPGKLVRTVPILLSKTTAQNIDLLISCRSKLGIPESNKLLFARPGTENPFIGANVIRKIQNCLQLKKPTHMTATSLRHHNKDMQNKPNGYVGEDWHNNDDEDGCNGNDEDCHNDTDDDWHSDDEEDHHTTIKQKCVKFKTRTRCTEDEKLVVIETFKNIDEDWHSDDEKDHHTTIKQKCVKFKTRTRWTEDEKLVVIETFKDLIKCSRNPGKKLCTELILKERLLKNRTWAQVNVLIDNFNKGKVALPSQYQYLRNC